MKTPGKFQITVFILGIAGAALFVQLLRSHGVTDTLAAVGALGWGLAAVVAFHFFPLLADALAWRALFPQRNAVEITSVFPRLVSRDAQRSAWSYLRSYVQATPSAPLRVAANREPLSAAFLIERPRLVQMLWMRWMGEAVSTLLPATAVGGDIVRARLAAIYSAVGIPLAAATVLVDITLSIFTQIIFTVTGLTLLVSATKHAIPARSVIEGAAVALLAVGAFYAIQRFGFFKLIGLLASKLAGAEEWSSFFESGQALDRDVRTLYTQKRGIMASACWTMSSWILGACEVWIALAAMGLPAHFSQALILESVGQGIRAALFLVPGALGVQELGYVEVGQMLGLPAHAALTLALVRRVRELSFGAPGVIAWQIVEARRALHGSPAAAS